MDTIKLIKARQIFDSRGNPTVEVEVTCSDGSVHRAAVPIGGSTVIYEAPKLRDGSSDYPGKAVLKAADNVNAIVGPDLIDKDSTEHTKIDASMPRQPLAWQLIRRMEEELGSSVSPFYAGYKFRSPVKPYRVKPCRDNVNAIIGPALIDKDPTEHTKIDTSVSRQPLGWQLMRRMEEELGSASSFYAGYKFRSPVKPYRSVLSDDLSPKPI